MSSRNYAPSYENMGKIWSVIGYLQKNATAPGGGEGGGVTDHSQLTSIGTRTHLQIDAHIISTSNPHGVTKLQVGLSNVDNTSDVDKPVSTAQQIALNSKQAVLVSGTNIKTVNGSSLLGAGDVTISGGSATTDASQLTSGILPDARLSSNIATVSYVQSYAISDLSATDFSGDGDTTPITINRTMLQEAVEDYVNSMLVAGSGISISYNDVTGKLTITNIGGGGAIPLSLIGNISSTYDTAGGAGNHKKIVSFTGAEAGDLQLVMFSFEVAADANAQTTPAGWTKIADTDHTALFSRVRLEADAATTDFMLPLIVTTSQPACCGAIIRGANAAGVVVGTPVSGGWGTTITAASVTSTVAPSLALAFFGSAFEAAAHTVSGWTEEQETMGYTAISSYHSIDMPTTGPSGTAVLTRTAGAAADSLDGFIVVIPST